MTMFLKSMGTFLKMPIDEDVECLFLHVHLIPLGTLRATWATARNTFQ